MPGIVIGVGWVLNAIKWLHLSVSLMACPSLLEIRRLESLMHELIILRLGSVYWKLHPKTEQRGVEGQRSKSPACWEVIWTVNSPQSGIPLLSTSRQITSQSPPPSPLLQEPTWIAAIVTQGVCKSLVCSHLISTLKLLPFRTLFNPIYFSSLFSLCFLSLHTHLHWQLSDVHGRFDPWAFAPANTVVHRSVARCL